MTSDVLDIRLHRYDEPIVQELIAELQAEYVVRYGDEDRSPVGPDDFTPPRGFFLVAWRGQDAVASVAMRAVDDQPGTVEVKRLYVRPAHRRQGLARMMLRGAEERARGAGYRRVVLETGTEQPESLKLYAGEGYDEIPGYGYYAGLAHSVCFAKPL
ncbi:GNAT family N-acetyltransferase [Pseudonocardia acidicola]|uniref:GNAT family N-acetyltransferase n=1 Tax=Pseudonocardia acidicola TaxID=2724939 RepID=UPI0030845489